MHYKSTRKECFLIIFICKNQKIFQLKIFHKNNIKTLDFFLSSAILSL